MKNTDPDTVASFGDEWTRFNRSGIDDAEAIKIFNKYFDIFPWSSLPRDAEGFDMGCGNGRWARSVAPRVGKLHCIDPSQAIGVATRNLGHLPNVSFHQASVDDQCLPANSQDFGYALGVLHHVPAAGAAIRACVDLLKPGAPLLLYLYYALENRPWWFRAVWRLSDFARRLISLLPSMLKSAMTDAIALLVYLPLSRLSKGLEKLGINVENVPLSFYRDHSFLTMRTDSRDRFGTPLEQRFTRPQVAQMMERAGLVDLVFSESAPYWCAVGFKRKASFSPSSSPR